MNADKNITRYTAIGFDEDTQSAVMVSDPEGAWVHVVDHFHYLREREAAKAGVTEELAIKAGKAIAARFSEGFFDQRMVMECGRAALEAVASMLTLAPYRSAIDLSTERCLAFRAGALWGLCNPQDVDEPVELYVSRPSNDYADTPWDWDRDASQAMLASARVPDGLLQLIRDARHRICNDAPSGLGKCPFDNPVYGPLLRRLDEADAMLAAAPKREGGI